jgi:hypothetical protein
MLLTPSELAGGLGTESVPPTAPRSGSAEYEILIIYK